MKIIRIIALIICTACPGCTEIQVPQFGTESPSNSQAAEGKIKTISISPMEKASDEPPSNSSKNHPIEHKQPMKHDMGNMNMQMNMHMDGK